ncbi:MAG: DUF106 domain-containing protein [Candidatus Lokiarchaeota archaeon]|nr:DUF106 domain-containing protein [Candidatus Lokiarchaeota archaeon]
MANGDIIVQIFLITVAMVGFSELLNKLMGLNMDTARELRDKAKNIQERMKTAQLTQDMGEMYKLQQESVQLSKQMMKKQLIPSCVRCLIFFGIFAILSVFYADYNEGIFPFPILIFGSGWFALYFLFSIGLNLLVWGGKKTYRKMTGKEDRRKKASKEILGMLSLQQQETEGNIQLTRPISESYIRKSPKTEEDPNKGDSWKDKIKR